MFNNDFISKQRPEPPEEIGYFNVYIRLPGPGGYQPVLQRVRFPVARYSRHRFRMHLLNLFLFNIK
jgi:hypothetical protein